MDPFADFRAGFATFLLALLGIVCLVTLAVTIVYVVQGEKDSARKMFKWVIVTAVGFILIEVIKNL